MILILAANTTESDVQQLLGKLNWMDLQAIASYEANRYKIAIVNGANAQTDSNAFKALPYVENVIAFKHKFKLASREYQTSDTIIQIDDKKIGGQHFTLIAGPCSIESEEQIHATAKAVAASGASILRGGAFKPRTSPYDFQGLGEIGLQYMQQAAAAHHLLTVTEVMDTKDVDLVAKYVHVLQIGARNMQNFNLLKAAGKTGKPILLKRGMSATYNDFLMAAEYILQTDNTNVILCERGIRTFETYARNTLDIAAVPILKSLTHLPIIIDPSHGVGLREFVPALSYAAIAVGAHGIMVEVHPHPEQAISDARQTISTETFGQMVQVIKGIANTQNITTDVIPAAAGVQNRH